MHHSERKREIFKFLLLSIWSLFMCISVYVQGKKVNYVKSSYQQRNGRPSSGLRIFLQALLKVLGIIMCKNFQHSSFLLLLFFRSISRWKGLWWLFRIVHPCKKHLSPSLNSSGSIAKFLIVFPSYSTPAASFLMCYYHGPLRPGQDTVQVSH